MAYQTRSEEASRDGRHTAPVPSRPGAVNPWGRYVGAAARKHIDHPLKAADMLRARIDIPLSDLQMSKKHRAIHSSTIRPPSGGGLSFK
jgi:hypothetical protein